MKKVFIMSLFLLFAIPGLVHANHGYDLTGIEVRPNDQAINQFLSDYSDLEIRGIYYDLYASGGTSTRSVFLLVAGDGAFHAQPEGNQLILVCSPGVNTINLNTQNQIIDHACGISLTQLYVEGSLRYDDRYYTDPPPPSAPDAPQNLTASYEHNEVVLSWDAVDDATNYNVYRDTVLIATTTTNSYTDNDVMHDQVYTYTVTAVNNYGESLHSTAINVDTTLPAEPPSPPTHVQAIAGSGRVTITWSSVTDAIGYNVYVDSVKSNTDLITGTKYTVTGLDHNKTYSFTVSAVGYNNLESTQSHSVQATPLPNQSVDLDGIDRVASALGVIGTAVSFIRTVVPDWLLVGLGIIFAYIIIRFLYWIVQKIRTEAFNRKNLNKESIVKDAKDGTLTKWTGKRDADGNRIREKVSEKEAAKLIKKYDRKDRINRMSTKEFDERIGREERQKMYDYLTAKGRISERDAWIRNTGTWGIKQRDLRSGRSVRPGRDSR